MISQLSFLVDILNHRVQVNSDKRRAICQFNSAKTASRGAVNAINAGKSDQMRSEK